jgi:electron transfer flavoprotein alpha subunit
MSGSVLVIAEQRRGELNTASLETLVAGQRAAEARGLELVVALLGKGAGGLLEQFSSYRVDRLLAVEHELLEAYCPEAYAAAVEALVRELEPEWVFFPHSYQARDFVPRVAARFARSLISDCVDIRSEGEQLVCVRQVFQGKLNADVAATGETPYFVSFQPAAFSVDALQPAAQACSVEIRAISLDISPVVTMQAETQEGGQAVDLSQAEIIVSVGRGVQEQSNIDLARQLATAIGGELAASRPVCDEGWLPIDRQVGSSGQTVAPKLYLALGISGASQHLMGMKGAKIIVAVNKDPKAPIFKVADYGIVGDVLEVMPALVEALKA